MAGGKLIDVLPRIEPKRVHIARIALGQRADNVQHGHRRYRIQHFDAYELIRLVDVSRRADGQQHGDIQLLDDIHGRERPASRQRFGRPDCLRRVKLYWRAIRNRSIGQRHGDLRSTPAGGGTSNVSTSTPNTWSAAQTFTGGINGNSTTTFNSSTIFSGITNALILTNGSGLASGYGGSNCAAGSLVTAISPTGTPSCVTTSTNLLNYITSSTPSTTIPTNDNQIANGANYTTLASSSVAATWQTNFDAIIAGANSLVQGWIQYFSNGLRIASGTGTWPISSATSSILTLGSSTIQGGSASGTFLGINASSGFNGDFLNFQVNSSSNFSVGHAGNISSTNIYDAAIPANTLALTTFSQSLVGYGGSSCTTGSLVTSIGGSGQATCETTSTILANYITSSTPSSTIYGAGAYLGASGSTRSSPHPRSPHPRFRSCFTTPRRPRLTVSKTCKPQTRKISLWLLVANLRRRQQPSSLDMPRQPLKRS